MQPTSCIIALDKDGMVDINLQGRDTLYTPETKASIQNTLAQGKERISPSSQIHHIPYAIFDFAFLTLSLGASEFLGPSTPCAIFWTHTYDIYSKIRLFHISPTIETGVFIVQKCSGGNCLPSHPPQ